MKRTDDYEKRREHLAELSDEELYDRFWGSIDKLIEPLLKYGYEYTSPAIERSVLLRMGFSSLEAKEIVNGCLEHSLLGHGAGNVVYRLSKAEGCGIRQAGELLIAGNSWNKAVKLFEGGSADE
ncbi:MAG: ornithine aminomutase subunit alpha [Clostridia bacterium]|nr:ornithine aminomutase subunit alpha [Clostridia bacterium]